MKSAIAAAALVAAVSAQSIADLPACSIQCVANAVTAIPCGLTDYACACPKADALTASVTPCVQKACTSAADQQKVITVLEGICANAGYPITISASATGATSTATDTSVTVTTSTSVASSSEQSSSVASTTATETSVTVTTSTSTTAAASGCSGSVSVKTISTSVTTVVPTVLYSTITLPCNTTTTTSTSKSTSTALVTVTAGAAANGAALGAAGFMALLAAAL